MLGVIRVTSLMRFVSSHGGVGLGVALVVIGGSVVIYTKRNKVQEN